MTLNIQRYPEGTSAEDLNLQAWSAFRKTLDEASASSSDVVVNALGENLRTILLEQSSSRRTTDLVDSWNEAERSLRMYQRLYLTDAIITTSGLCTVPRAVIAGNRDQAERRALDDLHKFVTLYRQALAEAAAPATPPTTDGSSGFQSDHRAALVSHLSSFFMPWTDGYKPHFANADAFEGAFIKDGASRDLANDAIALAEARADQTNECRDLEVRGIIPRGLPWPRTESGSEQ
jgi:hypothetical protein